MNLDRMLIDRMENRILVGLVAFVGIMVIVGWIIINEPARMAAFDDQYTGRSIERGAYLFNQNCATCHTNDGYGILNRAPGLNSPHLFGYDVFGDVDRQIRALADELERNSDLTAEEIEEIEAQIGELEAEREQILVSIEPAIEAGYPVDMPDRLDQAGWGGSLESYVYTTLVHGRPGSGEYWPGSEGMAAWGQTAGGPLRPDQLQDLTAYILNWDKGSAWTVEDLNAVAQFSKVPVDPAAVPMAAAEQGEGGETVGIDVDAILVGLEDFTGDPNNGQLLYTSYACAGCHMNASVAPLTEETWQSAEAGAGGRPHAGEPLRYVVESIVAPGEYIVEGYPAGAMPGNFGDRLTYQEMADIVAYIASYDS